MTYKITAYAGTFRIKDDLKARGFVWQSEDGGAWIKHHATELQLIQYRALERGAWSGIVFTVSQEETQPIDYDPNKHIEQGEII